MVVEKDLDHHTDSRNKIKQTAYTNVFEVLAEVDDLQVTSNVNLCCDFTLIDAVCTASVP